MARIVGSFVMSPLTGRRVEGVVKVYFGSGSMAITVAATDTVWDVAVSVCSAAKIVFSPFELGISVLYSTPDPSSLKVGEDRGGADAEVGERDQGGGNESGNTEGERGNHDSGLPEHYLNFEHFPWVAMLHGGNFLYLHSSLPGLLSRSTLRPALLSSPFLPTSSSPPSPGAISSSFAVLEKLKGRFVSSEQEMLIELKAASKIVIESLLFCHSLVCGVGFEERLMKKEDEMSEVVSIWVSSPILQQQLMAKELKKMALSNSTGKASPFSFTPSLFSGASPHPPSFSSLSLHSSSFSSPSPRTSRSLSSSISSSSSDPSLDSPSGSPPSFRFSPSSSPPIDPQPLPILSSDPLLFPTSPPLVAISQGGTEALGLMFEKEMGDKEQLEDLLTSSFSPSTLQEAKPLGEIFELTEGGKRKEEVVKGVAQAMYIISLAFSCQITPLHFLRYSQSRQSCPSLPPSLSDGLLYEARVKEWVMECVVGKEEERGDEERIGWFEFFELVCRESYEVGDVSTCLAIVDALTSADV